MDRRTFLGVVACSVLAGCAGDGSAGPADTDTVSAPGTEPPIVTDAEELDLREANVVEVAAEGSPGETVRFDVTLFHDDEGEDGYADWWQVETIDGTPLGRRELLHAHATAPFTRSTTVDVPADVDCVVVRGHDQVHGYGGRAMLVNLESGATGAFDRGPEPAGFEPSDCP